MAHVKRAEHIPVLADAITKFLARPKAVLIDGTLGDGGHAELLLQASGDDATLLGMDLDTEGLERAKVRLAPFGSRVSTVHDTFAHIATVARTLVAPPTGIFFDLGMSTHHLNVERGFSFQQPGILDMRFDASGNVELPLPTHPALQRLAKRQHAYTAADILRTLREDELADILSLYGEEPYADRIAEAIVHTRRRESIQTVPALVQCIVHAFPPKARHKKTHAATKTFQALRIAVNREQETLQEGLRGALSVLAPGGRLAVLTFHSGEDRMVKQFFRAEANAGAATLLTKHAIAPSFAEITRNRWSRSAHLRILERSFISSNTNILNNP